MKFEDHCRQSIELFTAPWEDVHRWLDEFDGAKRHGMRHRRVWHHAAGVRKAARMPGREAAAIAKRHIVAAMLSPLWACWPFPAPRAIGESLSSCVTNP